MVLLTRKKLCDRLQRTGPLLSENAISFCLSAFPIYFRNTFFDPLTSTGEHPSPTSGLIAPCRLGSSLNQPAHSGTTPSAPLLAKGNHLLVAHTLRRLKAENPDIAEVRGENLTALGQSFA